MKRDMDLIRKLLETAEASTTPVSFSRASIENDFNMSVEEFSYNLILLMKHGFIEGGMTSAGGYITSLTWEGHDFLDNLKNPVIFQVAQKVSDVSFSSVVAAVSTAGVEIVLKALGL